VGDHATSLGHKPLPAGPSLPLEILHFPNSQPKHGQLPIGALTDINRVVNFSWRRGPSPA
jgi:hypothetical protein